MRNKRDTIVYKGQKFNNIAELALKYGISAQQVCYWIRHGKSLDEAVTNQIKKRNKREVEGIVDKLLKKAAYNGEITETEIEQIIGYLFCDFRRYIEQSIKSETKYNWETIARYSGYQSLTDEFINYFCNEVLETKIFNIANEYTLALGKTKNTGIIPIIHNSEIYKHIIKEYINDLEKEVLQPIRKEEIEALGKHIAVSCKEILAEAFSILSDRERKILELRFGLIDGKVQTFEEIGKTLGISNNRVGQIVSRALQKLQYRSIYIKLKEHMDAFNAMRL